MTEPSTGAAPEEVLGKAYDTRLMKHLWQFVRPHWRLLLIGLALIPMSVGFELTQPYLLKVAIDNYIAAGNLDGLGSIALLYIAFVLLQAFTSYGQLYCLQLIGQRSMNGLRIAIYKHVIGQRHSFFDTRPVGRLLTRMTNDVETINEIFTSGVVTLIADFIKMTAIIAMMLSLNVKLTLITFASAPILAVVFIYARNIMRRSFRKIRVKLAAMNAFVQEHISGVKVVQLFRKQAPVAAAYDDLNAGHRDAYLSSIRADATMYATVEAVGVSSAAAIAWYSGATIGETGLTVGLVVAFLEYVHKFFIPVRDLSSKYAVMQSAMAATERIVELLDTHEPDAVVVMRPNLETTGSADSAIVFESVEFSYREQEKVLFGVNLKVRTGETLAIVGATGSGKSTLMKLLSRFYEPTAGTILLAGQRIETIDRRALRQRITMVSQDVFMFAGTIGDNVRLGRHDATDEQVLDALERVGADRFMHARELTIGSKVAERGSNLSAGERQLIAFARALIRDPEILILDEATAHVDPESEALIERGLAELMRGRTTLVIAHRLSTIRNADTIAVLSYGRVAEHGSHDELVAQGGLYATLENTFRQT